MILLQWVTKVEQSIELFDSLLENLKVLENERSIFLQYNISDDKDLEDEKPLFPQQDVIDDINDVIVQLQQTKENLNEKIEKIKQSKTYLKEKDDAYY